MSDILVYSKCKAQDAYNKNNTVKGEMKKWLS